MKTLTTYLRIPLTMAANGSSQEYIFIARIPLMTSPIIFTLLSVMLPILFLNEKQQ